MGLNFYPFFLKLSDVLPMQNSLPQCTMLKICLLMHCSGCLTQSRVPTFNCHMIGENAALWLNINATSLLSLHRVSLNYTLSPAI